MSTAVRAELERRNFRFADGTVLEEGTWRRGLGRGKPARVMGGRRSGCAGPCAASQLARERGMSASAFVDVLESVLLRDRVSTVSADIVLQARDKLVRGARVRVARVGLHAGRAGEGVRGGRVAANLR